MKTKQTPAATPSAPTRHLRDEHCEDAGTLNDKDECRECGAASGDQCPSCGGYRYHDNGCIESSPGELVADPADEPAPIVSGGIADRVAAQMKALFPDARGMTCRPSVVAKGGQPWDTTVVAFMVGEKLVTLMVSVE